MKRYLLIGVGFGVITWVLFALVTESFFFALFMGATLGAIAALLLGTTGDSRTMTCPTCEGAGRVWKDQTHDVHDMRITRDAKPPSAERA